MVGWQVVEEVRSAGCSRPPRPAMSFHELAAFCKQPPDGWCPLSLETSSQICRIG